MSAQIAFPQDLAHNTQYRALTESDIQSRIDAGIEIRTFRGEYPDYSRGILYMRTYYQRTFKLKGNRLLDKNIGFNKDLDVALRDRNRVEKYTVARLRELLTEQGLPTNGLKSQLVDRYLTNDPARL